MNASAADVAGRLAAVRAEVEAARIASGRTDVVEIMAVTKTVPPEVVRTAYAAGQRTFGENRVQEGVAKIAALAGALPAARWHMIGHLQSNKASAAARHFSIVESVDSVKLARVLNDIARERFPVLLEVNVAGERSKHGFTAAELRSAMPELLALPGLSIRGLMTVAPLVADPEDVRWVFRNLRELRDELRDDHRVPGLVELSMGMSGDFPVAIQEGATMVRIGRAIFGDRPVRHGEREIG